MPLKLSRRDVKHQSLGCFYSKSLKRSLKESLNMNLELQKIYFTQFITHMNDINFQHLVHF